MRDEFPRERVATGIALISATFAVGGGIGIMLAGPIIQNLNYHYLFWIPLVPVLIRARRDLAVGAGVPVLSPGKVNWLGAILLSGWLVCLLLGLSEAPTWHWLSVRVIGLFAAALVLMLLWVRAESRSSEPLVDLKMMRVRGVWTVNLATVLIGFGMYNAFVLIPSSSRRRRRRATASGPSVTQAGLFLLPETSLMMLVSSPIAGPHGRSRRDLASR